MYYAAEVTDVCGGSSGYVMDACGDMRLVSGTSG